VSSLTDFIVQTYLFYDLETSGLSPCFDQVYQFAAIRTDMDLKELERYEFIVKPTIDVIPSIQASVTHRLSMERLENEGMPEHEAIFKIHQLLNTPGTISLGYNTLTFDDEFLRFNFYRHLLTPYTHQFANQCRRMDLFPMVVFYYLGRQDHLKWGLRNDKVSLKLEDLSLENHLSDGPAHNAMVDVAATVQLARRLKEDTKMWESLLGCFVKNEDLLRLGKLPLVDVGGVSYPMGLAVNGRFGVAKSYQVPVLGLGQHWHYANQTIWLNLDDERILSGDEALIPELWSTKKKPAEPPFIMQPKAPFDMINDERKALVAETLKFLQLNQGFFKAIQDYMLDFKFPVYQETDLDAKLYHLPFLQDQDVYTMRQFWQSEANARVDCISRFRQQELQQLGWRFMGRFYPEALPSERKKEFDDYIARIWAHEVSNVADYQMKPHLTRFEALRQVEETDLTDLDDEQKAVLASVKAYLQKSVALE